MTLIRETLRLYAVTDRSWVGDKTLYEQVEAALKGGVTCVQLREKELDKAAFLAEAKEMKALCHAYGVPLLINDNVDIALAADADGVHLGQSDMNPKKARELLGAEKIIGVSARTVEQAESAEEAKADYLGSGAVFGTATKKDAKAMPISRLKEICRAVKIPVIAIGGVNSDNIKELKDSGIAGVAVVSAIFAAEDIEARCRRLRREAEKAAR